MTVIAAHGDQDRERGVWLVVLAAVLVGAGLRIAEVAQGHTFGFDDTSLAINIASRTMAGLVRPLGFEQTAPVLFLWIDRALVDVFGVNGVSLRLLPLASGIAVLPLTWVVGRQLVPARAAALAVALLAVSPLAVDYSDTVKPYIVDAAVALVLIALALRVRRTPDDPRAWQLLSLGGAVALLLSTPAVFTLAACAAVLVIPAATRRRAALWMLVWLLVAAGQYLAIQRATAHNAALQRFWAQSFFVPGAPDLAARVRVVASSYVQNLYFGTSVRAAIALRVGVALLVVLGAVRAWRRPGPWAAGLLVGPLALAVLAAAIRLYPPSDRTWLFTAPSLALLAAAGLAVLVDQLPERARTLALVGCGVAAVILPARQSLLVLRAKLAPDRLTEALEDWRTHTAPGEPIYVFSRDALRWTYYTTNWARPDTARLAWLIGATQSIGPNSGNAPARRHAVRDEGRTLVYTAAGRPELIGVATGMEDGIPNPDPAPDSGWADNEAGRIADAARAAPDSTAWLFLLYCEPTVDSALIHATEAHGARLLRHTQHDRVRLYQLRF
jgi:hypothetical protein